MIKALVNLLNNGDTDGGRKLINAYLGNIDLSLDSEINDNALSSLAEILQEEGMIKSLKIKDLAWKNINKSELFEGLIEGCTLEHLTLGGCGITSLEAIKLFDRLRNCAFLSTLDLSGNHIDTHTCNSISHALSLMPHLRKLNLSENPIGEHGFQKLFQNLTNFQLTELYMSECRIGDTDFSLFATYAIGCNGLKIIDLAYNDITEKAGVYLGQIIYKSFSLEELYFTYNQICVIYIPYNQRDVRKSPNFLVGLYAT